MPKIRILKFLTLTACFVFLAILNIKYVLATASEWDIKKNASNYLEFNWSGTNSPFYIYPTYIQIAAENGATGEGGQIGLAGTGVNPYFYLDVLNDRFRIHAGGTEKMTILSDGKIGIGVTNPAAKLDVNGTLKVGGSATGDSTSDIKAYIQKIACENRRGVWTDNTGCKEYATYGAICTYTSCSCQAGYHGCSLVDMFSGGFQSLRRPGNNPPTAYTWVTGAYLAGYQNYYMYPWGYNTNSDLTCSANTHYMIDMSSRDGNTAWGCYADSYTGASITCCSNSQ